MYLQIHARAHTHTHTHARLETGRGAPTHRTTHSLQLTATHCNALQRTATHCHAHTHRKGETSTQDDRLTRRAAPAGHAQVRSSTAYGSGGVVCLALQRTATHCHAHTHRKGEIGVVCLAHHIACLRVYVSRLHRIEKNLDSLISRGTNSNWKSGRI